MSHETISHRLFLRCDVFSVHSLFDSNIHAIRSASGSNYRYPRGNSNSNTSANANTNADAGTYARA